MEEFLHCEEEKKNALEKMLVRIRDYVIPSMNDLTIQINQIKLLVKKYDVLYKKKAKAMNYQLVFCLCIKKSLGKMH